LDKEYKVIPSAHRERRAPYAPIGALRDFLERIRHENPPARIDVAYLQRNEIAPKNEYALISALKYLGILDARGHPTPIFRRLQGSEETARETLKNLVLAAYAPLFEDGGAEMSDEQLYDWFTQHSSVSQARNAARFFKEVCQQAGISLRATEPGASFKKRGSTDTPFASGSPADSASAVSAIPLRPLPEPLPPQAKDNQEVGSSTLTSSSSLETERFQARSKLLEKLPAYQDGWSIEDYRRVVELFNEMLHSL
jgi:hypothetical protein